MKRLILSVLCFCFGLMIQAQQAIDSVYTAKLQTAFRQVTDFSQEKIYLHTDKPYYFSGDTIYLKAYLVDAITHLPSDKSHFVYVELLNRKDKVVQRIKIKKEEDCFLGSFFLEEQQEEGEYYLRAYTQWMQNEAPEFFYSKNIKIYASQSSLVNMSIRYMEEADKRKAIITFKKPDGSVYTGNYAHYMVRTKPFGNDFRQQQLNKQGEITVGIPEKEEVDQYIYVVLEDGKLKHKRTFYVPNRFDYEVDFFPEGGCLIPGTVQKVGVKAINTDGKSVEFTGAVLNEANDTVVAFKSAYAGMGNFMLPVREGEDYKAVITAGNGLQKTFRLPDAERGRLSLSVSERRGSLYYHILHEPERALPASMYLVGHVRGVILFVKPIDTEQGMIGLERIPDGILTLTLLDKDCLPHSERLFFVRRKDEVAWKVNVPNGITAPRSQVLVQVGATDVDGNPLQGDFSVSITDDYAISQDSVGDHILSNLLLTSDLKGHIETPGYYFRNHSSRLKACLDNLMLTQGWSRFDLERLMKDHRETYTYPIEQGQYVSGKVLSANGKPQEGKVVSVTVDKKLYPAMVTGADGTFVIDRLDFEHSIQVSAKVIEKDKLLRSELRLDREHFPEPSNKHPYAFESYVPRNDYVTEIQSPYIEVDGMLMLNLPEVVVSGRSLVKDRFSSYKLDDEEMVSQKNARTALDLVKEVPGFQIIDNRPYVNPNYSQRPKHLMSNDVDNRNALRPTGKPSYGRPATFMLDNRAISFRDLPLIDADDIVSVHKIDPEVNSIINIAQNMRMLEASYEEAMDNGATLEELETMDYIGLMKTALDGEHVTLGGCIILTSRTGNLLPPRNNSQGDAIVLTGYDKYKGFYHPKYETKAQQEVPAPDKRTTLFWQPKFRLNAQGEGNLSFYSADRNFSTYTVTIEGMTTDGRPVRYIETIK